MLDGQAMYYDGVVKVSSFQGVQYGTHVYSCGYLAVIIIPLDSHSSLLTAVIHFN